MMFCPFSIQISETSCETIVFWETNYLTWRLLINENYDMHVRVCNAIIILLLFGILTSNPEMSEYFFAGLNDGGASMVLSEIINQSQYTIDNFINVLLKSTN